MQVCMCILCFFFSSFLSYSDLFPYFFLDACLFSNEGEEKKGVDLGGLGGGRVWKKSWGVETNQKILCRKNVFI